MGMGPAEIFIIGIIVLVLFGPTLVAFFIGYTLGKKKGAESPPTAPAPTTPKSAPDAQPPEPTEQTTDLQEVQPDE